MKMLLITMTVLALAVLLVSPGALYAQETEPAAVLSALADAVNAGDVEAALALFADDAVVNIVPPPPGESGTYSGLEEIGPWLEGLVADNFEIQIEVLKVEGDTVTTKTTSWADPTRQLGIAPLVGTEVYTVQDGKIKGFTYTMSDESLAKLQAALAALPETGGTTPTGTLLLWLGVGGLLLFALGLGLRRASGHAR